MKQFKIFWCMFSYFVQLTMGKFNIDSDPWPDQLVTWPQDHPLLPHQIPELSRIDLEAFIKKSTDFPIKFPIDSTRCAQLKTKTDPDELEKNINSAYPLVHEQVLTLMVGFLNQKTRFGTPKERDFYKNMTLLEFIDRLLTKRAVTFVGPDDQYLLIDGTRGQGRWETIGTNDEKPPLILQNCLSYDEIKLSALLLVSSRSYFLKKDEIQGKGVVIGAIGPRLNKENVMEYREIMKTREQNTHVNGYGQFFVPTLQGIFMNFYGDVSLSYPELETREVFKNTDRFIELGEGKYFDKWVYRRRLALAIDGLLMDANERAKEIKTSAYIQVGGLVLQEWKITPEQDVILIETFKQRIKFLGPHLSHVSDVILSKTGEQKINEKIPVEGHPFKEIRLQNQKGKPLLKLTGADEEKLLVVSYVWNGNSLPGNDYWLPNSTNCATPSAAQNTQITELQNSYINDNLRAANLRIITIEGIISFKDYINKLK